MLTESEFSELFEKYKTGSIQPSELTMLAPYRADNAVIMAAGTATRFAPLSWERPKGLLTVRGEKLIERQIRQLREAGIENITLITGYLGEQFSYLREKFGIELVDNPEYACCNNTSSLLRVLERLKNTYVCSSDNYFSENVFEPFVYKPYYSAVFIPGESDEWGLVCDTDGRITAIDHAPTNRWCMMGHVYFNCAFSAAFAALLAEKYERDDTKQLLWESLYERHISALPPLYIRRYAEGIIREFDSLEDLREFDKAYLESSGSIILQQLCQSLGCREKDLKNIRGLKGEGQAFAYSFRGKEYVFKL